MTELRALAGRMWARFPVRVVSLLLLSVVGYWLIQRLGFEANTVAAVATAVAAVAAFGAAHESRTTARDARLALAMATKPDPQVWLEPGTNTISDSADQTFSIEVENFSQHGIGHMELTWRLRDGSTGTRAMGPLGGRATPFGGMIHSPGPAVTEALGQHDAGLTGTDRVSLKFSDAQGLQVWERVREWRWEVQANSAPRVTRVRIAPPDRAL